MCKSVKCCVCCDRGWLWNRHGYVACPGCSTSTTTDRTVYTSIPLRTA
jgi:hypothetical protein